MDYFTGMYSTPQPAMLLTPEDVLLGGNFHRGFAAYMLMWYLFGRSPLGNALLWSMGTGLLTMCTAAFVEGSYQRRATRNEAHSPTIAAVIRPFKLFGYFDILERKIPVWLPTSMSHSVPMEVFGYYEKVRNYLAVSN
jgi:hypothetical protein